MKEFHISPQEMYLLDSGEGLETFTEYFGWLVKTFLRLVGLHWGLLILVFLKSWIWP